MDKIIQKLSETYRQIVVNQLIEENSIGDMAKGAGNVFANYLPNLLSRRSSDLPSHVIGPGQVDLSRTPVQRENIGGQWHLPPGTTPEQAENIRKQEMAKRKAEWAEANAEDQSAYDKQALAVAVGTVPLAMAGGSRLIGALAKDPNLDPLAVGLLAGPGSGVMAGGMKAAEMMSPFHYRNPFREKQIKENNMDRWTQQLTETYRQMVLARLMEENEDLPPMLRHPTTPQWAIDDFRRKMAEKKAKEADHTKLATQNPLETTAQNLVNSGGQSRGTPEVGTTSETEGLGNAFVATTTTSSGVPGRPTEQNKSFIPRMSNPKR